MGPSSEFKIRDSIQRGVTYKRRIAILKGNEYIHMLALKPLARFQTVKEN